MALKYYICGDAIPKMNSPRIKDKCRDIEAFVSTGDDNTLSAIKGLCAAIVDDVDEITRDRLKGSVLALDIKMKALAFRKARNGVSRL